MADEQETREEPDKQEPGEEAASARPDADEPPTEDELRAALDRVAVSDVLLPTLATVASVGFHKLTPEARDLAQARLAIEALRALEPVLREGGVDEAVVRDLEQARSNLQLAFAKAVEEEKVGGG